MKNRSVELLTFFVAMILFSAPGCVLVGGYSSGRGFWIWPGSFVIIAIVVLAFLLLRRR